MRALGSEALEEVAMRQCQGAVSVSAAGRIQERFGELKDGPEQEARGGAKQVEGSA